VPDPEGVARRVVGRPQISTDKLHAYQGAIFQAWSIREGKGWNRPSWGTIVKRYEVEPMIRVGPAVASGVAEKAWTLGELVEWGELYGQ